MSKLLKTFKRFRFLHGADPAVFPASVVIKSNQLELILNNFSLALIQSPHIDKSVFSDQAISVAYAPAPLSAFEIAQFFLILES
ncbi:hypothetical protein EBME_0999 [bacterium endosymbiont of Mortierella elongata FMR23-6]|nr:hypothetical protein EBME_0999 [bacterium endosymbiont of Mortierella elongata FMR23-6]